jgi:putative FmdB family regulatory protein
MSMPLYEYICHDCHHRFETLVTASRQPVCPACHSVTLDKQHSVFAVAARSSSSAQAADIAPCGSCGDPRGAGACRLD